MKVKPIAIPQVLGIISLASIVSLANADPKIISTYEASKTLAKTTNTSGTAGTYEKSSGSTSTSSSSGTQTNSPGTTYTIPSNFNFNCDTRNPNADAIENGRRAYVRLNCSVCHSSTGHGGTMGPSLVGEGDEVAEAVTQGEGEGMPSFKKYLCPNDLTDLKAYVDSLSNSNSPDFTDWWVPNPPARWADSQ